MCPAVPMMSGMLGGCPGNHGGCGERSGGARRQPRYQMAARSSLLRRPTPGARPARRTSSVVAALAALAPRLVRLAHHDYPDRLLASAPMVSPSVMARRSRPALPAGMWFLLALGLPFVCAVTVTGIYLDKEGVVAAAWVAFAVAGAILFDPLVGGIAMAGGVLLAAHRSEK